MMTEKDKLELRECCRVLRLSAIAENFEMFAEEETGCQEYLLRLLRAQVELKGQKAVEQRIKAAKFPYRKYLEDLETGCMPEGIRKRLPELTSLDFIRRGQNVVFTGNPGTGKIHTAIGLGIKACEAGYKVLFTTVPYLVTELKETHDQQKLTAYERKFRNYDLVIADELGYVSFDREGADLLFNNLSQRVGLKSTIITSNLSFSDWEQVFGDPAITGAMVDRLTFGAILVDMQGDSYRLRETIRVNGIDKAYVMDGKKDA